MRTLAAILVLPLLLPQALALGALPGGASVVLDLPALSPVRVTDPALPAPEPDPVPLRAPAPEDVRLEGPPGALLVEAPFVRAEIAPPALRTPAMPIARIARADAPAAPAPPRAPVPPSATPLPQDPAPTAMRFDPVGPTHGPADAQAPLPRATPAPAPAPPGEPDAPPTTSGRAGAARAAALAVLVVALAMYHRLTREEVHGQDTRVRILGALAGTPGLSVAQLARALALDATTVSYHLRLLVRERAVGTTGEARRAVYFPAGVTPAAARSRAATTGAAGRVLGAVRATPGARKTELARALAIARATLAWHLARLERAGLVRLEARGRDVHVFPQESFS